MKLRIIKWSPILPFLPMQNIALSHVILKAWHLIQRQIFYTIWGISLSNDTTFHLFQKRMKKIKDLNLISSESSTMRRRRGGFPFSLSVRNKCFPVLPTIKCAVSNALLSKNGRPQRNGSWFSKPNHETTTMRNKRKQQKLSSAIKTLKYYTDPTGTNPIFCYKLPSTASLTSHLHGGLLST